MKQPAKIPTKKSPAGVKKPRTKKVVEPPIAELLKNPTARVVPKTEPNVQNIPLHTPEATQIHTIYQTNAATCRVYILQQKRQNGQMSLRYSHMEYYNERKAREAFENGAVTFGLWFSFD